jgi:hypothetical protein
MILSDLSGATTVRTYEAVTEPVAKMAGVLGRWGDGSELPLVLDTLQLLYAHAEKAGGGLVYWLNIRSYPAVLIFTAYSLALTRAQRWAALHQLLTVEMFPNHGGFARLVDTLFLWEWKGYEDDLWKQLEGLERRKTALSDHLAALFSEWVKSFAGLTAEFDLLFDRFEMLGSLAHLESMPESDFDLTLTQQGRSDPVRMPVGRIGWATANRRRLLQELEASSTKNALLTAGFANGSERFLELFNINLKRVANYMSW